MLAAEEMVQRRCRDRSNLYRLWDVCQTPDFRKTTVDDHIRLVRTLFEHLIGPTMRLSDDWMAAQFRQVDRIEGDIDTLSARLAGVRTLAYLSHRPDWTASRTLCMRSSWRASSTGGPAPCCGGSAMMANSWPEWRPMAR